MDEVIKVEDGSIITPQGFSAAGLHTGVKRKRNDLGILLSTVPAEAAAVYTMNRVKAAPIGVTKASLQQEGRLQAVIVNSGNANACTGKQGITDAYTMRAVTAQQFSLQEHHVAVASTGVIGQAMPMEKIVPGIAQLHPEVDDLAAEAFAQAILTTDTREKSSCYQTTIDGKLVTLAGIAKGSGMIAPNMATMLAFITTDAVIQHDVLQQELRVVTDVTFNRITVDGDTSTNDMVIVMANGLAGNEPLTPDHTEWWKFEELLLKVCEDLARMIARDGEGATKLIEVEVFGAEGDEEAGKVAKAVVGSDLVKTAIYGEDPNWGRIMMAIGKSGVPIDPDLVDIAIGPFQMINRSQPLAFSDEGIRHYLANEEIQISIHLNQGEGYGKAWGCDLTYAYVRINASYTT
ncbi:bifunctional glutamate N-acetyltransferase/amino-acid acetyltransferase ArgJ [Rubeoparvulum massiliense]|uniref:bifunctional glutamate N-acetyltransferase/amino-acid acetyltransferase ArgJ n=1 Tax=Rubeoparvulum massiliense TaxID=1631346 RepID=UPI00065E74EF|nr:bifunctional glutamate N-acetyltransferase/amino-acid acetyltransferase ArgJ [Rubeoparvulum massiliense]